MKKVFALLLSVAMVICMMPTVAFADCDPSAHNPSEDWTSDGTNHWHTCQNADCTAKIDEAAHTYGAWEVTKEPTADEAGAKKRTCTVCGYEETGTIDAGHEHTYTDNDWKSDETNHWQECNVCGVPKEFVAHTYGEWTVIEEATATEKGSKKHTCSVCNYEETVEIPATGGGGGGGIYIPPTTDPLPTTKTESTNAVQNYVKPADYEDAEAAEIKAIMDKAAADIKNAKTVEEVKAIEAAAKAEIDKLETAEEKAVIRTVEATKFRATSKNTKLNGKKAIKITWTVPEGMEFDGFEVFRSTKQYSGFGTKPFFTTTKQQYTNNKDLKAGKTYYYKVRAYKYVNDEKVYTEYSFKAIRTVK